MKNTTHWIFDMIFENNALTIVFKDLHSDKTEYFCNNIYEDINLKNLKEFIVSNIQCWFLGFDCHNKVYFLEYILTNDNIFYSSKDIKEILNNEFNDIFELHYIDISIINNWKYKNITLDWIKYSLNEDIDNINSASAKKIISLKGYSEYYSFLIEHNTSIIKYLYQYYYQDIKIRTRLFNHLNLKDFNINNSTFVEYVFNRYCVKDNEPLSLNLPKIKFDNIKFNKLYENTRKITIQIDDVDINYSFGGMHSRRDTASIYKSVHNKIIKSLDIKSYYATIILNNKWSPKNFNNNGFLKILNYFYQLRLKHYTNKHLSNLLKEILVITCGLFSVKKSSLYDRELAFKMYKTGQLILSKFIDMVSNKIPLSELIMVNTDGCEYLIPKEHEYIYNDIVEEWKQMFNLNLSLNDCEELYLWDINNYILVKKGNIKCRGRFRHKDLCVEKDRSNLIIPLTIYNYFLNGINVESYIFKNDNIYDFCTGLKIKGNWRFYDDKNNDYGQTIRYYISNKGTTIYKSNGKDKIIVAKNATIFNEFEPKKTYDVNHKYYIDIIQREIAEIETKKEIADKTDQLSLF